jgi:hypothetical protein
MKLPMGNTLALSLAVALGAISLCPQAHAVPADLDCKLRFSLSGWSAILQHAEGDGIVTCADGESLHVKISAKGAGLTVGKTRIDNGTGRFTDVRMLTDVLGNYAQGEAHAGIVKSGTAQLLTKGTVSLALAGKGEGIDLGVDVGEFTLARDDAR